MQMARPPGAAKTHDRKLLAVTILDSDPTKERKHEKNDPVAGRLGGSVGVRVRGDGSVQPGGHGGGGCVGGSEMQHHDLQRDAALLRAVCLPPGSLPHRLTCDHSRGRRKPGAARRFR